MYYSCIAISNRLHDVKSLSLFVSVEHKVFFHSGEQWNRYSCQGVSMVTLWRAHPNSPRGMNDIQTRIRNPPGYTHPIFNLTYHLPSYQPCVVLLFAITGTCTNSVQRVYSCMYVDRCIVYFYIH